MKIRNFNLLCIAGLLIFSACNEDEPKTENRERQVPPGTVTFDFDNTPYDYREPGLRSSDPTSPQAGLYILAFRESPGTNEYYFDRTITTADLSLNNNENAATFLLPAGKYKLLTIYDITPDSGFTGQELLSGQTLLTDNLKLFDKPDSSRTDLWIESRTVNELPVITVGSGTGNAPRFTPQLKRAGS